MSCLRLVSSIHSFFNESGDMKYSCLSIPIIFMFFIGCSSYKVINYPSKEAFHEDVNGSMKNRDVNVVTVDSSFTALEGSRIEDDSLQIVANIQEKIPQSEIKDIKYYGNAYEVPSAYIWLKSGEELNTKTVRVLPDSTVQFINITNKYIPLTDVKHINYTNHWVGLGTGTFAGILTGLIVASIMVNQSEAWSRTGGTFLVIPGTVVGAILGAIIGWDMIYQFGP
jgi:hypothetical protein